MSHKAIANASRIDAQVLVELSTVATGIHNLINEIEAVENASIPVPVVPVVPVAPVAPVANFGALNSLPAVPVSVPAATDNGIDFLVP
jgi:hypothetical protein